MKGKGRRKEKKKWLRLWCRYEEESMYKVKVCRHVQTQRGTGATIEV